MHSYLSQSNFSRYKTITILHKTKKMNTVKQHNFFKPLRFKIRIWKLYFLNAQNNDIHKNHRRSVFVFYFEFSLTVALDGSLSASIARGWRLLVGAQRCTETGRTQHKQYNNEVGSASRQLSALKQF